MVRCGLCRAAEAYGAWSRGAPVAFEEGEAWYLAALQEGPYGYLVGQNLALEYWPMLYSFEGVRGKPMWTD